MWLQYLRLDGAQPFHPLNLRRKIVLFQLATLFLLCINLFLHKSIFQILIRPFPLVMHALSFMSGIFVVHFSVALFSSLRWNFPKMVRSKSIELFLFIFLLLFSSFLSLGFWILFSVFSIKNLSVCNSTICSGIIKGCFFYVNLLAIICLVIISFSKKDFGFGINFFEHFDD
ncbi:uncharacterized protein LOC126325866 [Schistocerca gregaria]|uniref:uncharacterized protein LOC126325866 n=1 Tax=Schistocerca gregaria TaxID=7010 RepID=UPI00211ECD11|nr:uncharacterized protein LOC126325866 [Schistocerca gregaria]